MSLLPYLAWIDAQHDDMVSLLTKWAEINTGTFNLAGLAKLRGLIAERLQELTKDVLERPVTPYEVVDARGLTSQVQGAATLVASQRPAAKRRVLLAIHVDTVYAADALFQKVTRLDDNTLQGPGVADAKGGLVVLLYALSALERFLLVHTDAELGWDVIINADEEVGSLGSDAIFREYAPRVQRGLLFEPSLPDGTLISARKGSGNFAAVVRGRAAHAGRDFDQGRNAVVAAARVAAALDELNGRFPAATINVGRIEGGGPTNVVPEIAIVRWNVRHEALDDAAALTAKFEQIVAKANQQEGIRVKLHGAFTAPPKPMNAPIRGMLDAVVATGRELGLTLGWQASGGVCDGNRLAGYGVPNIDTLGVRGGNIHSDREYVLLDSLCERAKLSALLLMKMALGEIP